MSVLADDSPSASKANSNTTADGHSIHTSHTRLPYINLTLDFDSTLTNDDTLSTLYTSLFPAITTSTNTYTHTHTHNNEHNQSNPSVPPFSELTSAYLRDLFAHDESTNTTPPASPSSSEASLTSHFHKLSHSGLRAVEKSSFERVAGVCRSSGVTAGDMEDAARRAVEAGDVRMRRGWPDFLREVQCWNEQRGSSEGGEGVGAGSMQRISIISVNWSGTWIQGCLRAAAAAEGSHAEYSRSDLIDDIQIYTNEIPFASPSSHHSARSGRETNPAPSNTPPASTTEDGPERRKHTHAHPLKSSNDEQAEDMGVDVGIFTTADKLRVYSQLHPTSTCAEGPDDKEINIYIGDSPTDLAPLLASDIGILIRDDPMRSGQRELDNILQECLDRSNGTEIKHILSSPALTLQDHLTSPRDKKNKHTSPSSSSPPRRSGTPQHLHDPQLSHLLSELSKNPPTIFWARDFHELSDWLSP
ncbi:MAG: hypothetical protein M1831_004362 [Alyxoria varia]|nr:MAG: hypothetical protein M1831_004362 [Alyxoria varia]